jgi:hypothetical protein
MKIVAKSPYMLYTSWRIFSAFSEGMVSGEKRLMAEKGIKRRVAVIVNFFKIRR